jgi:hypothetical protein
MQNVSPAGTMCHGPTSTSAKPFQEPRRLACWI